MLKNWDNNTWISSKSYIETFNKFMFKQISLNENSKILEIGCARGKILGDLKSKLKLIFKPIGLDAVNHNDKDKRVSFL